MKTNRQRENVCKCRWNLTGNCKKELVEEERQINNLRRRETYKQREREKQRDRDRDRRTDRQTDRETDRDRDKDRARQRDRQTERQDRKIDKTMHSDVDQFSIRL